MSWIKKIEKQQLNNIDRIIIDDIQFNFLLNVEQIYIEILTWNGISNVIIDR